MTKPAKNKTVPAGHWRSAVTRLHYFRLVYRSCLLIFVLFLYIRSRITSAPFPINNSGNPFLFVIWASFMLEMILRFFPSRFESPGCQKQFSINYTPTGSTDIKLHDNNAVVIVALLWVILNGTIGAFHMTGFIDDGILLLISLVYSVCDMVCILFFCPFQTWFLKNRCCSSCRIYNWDYAMMFTPLFFMPGRYTWSLLAAAALLMLRWEITVWQFPERFSENTNAYLTCANCTEKLCTEKTQLIRFRKELNRYAEMQKERILSIRSKK